MQHGFLKDFLPLIKKTGRKIYLETNGTLTNELSEIIDLTDIIAMDFKLPSSSGLDEYWRVHEAFLKKAHTKEVFTKAVITADTTEEELDKACSIIGGIDQGIPLILQPVTPSGGTEEPEQVRLHTLKALCTERLRRVEIIPQLQKQAGVR